VTIEKFTEKDIRWVSTIGLAKRVNKIIDHINSQEKNTSTSDKAGDLHEGIKRMMCFSCDDWTTTIIHSYGVAGGEYLKCHRCGCVIIELKTPEDKK